MLNVSNGRPVTSLWFNDRLVQRPVGGRTLIICTKLIRYMCSCHQAAVLWLFRYFALVCPSRTTKEG